MMWRNIPALFRPSLHAILHDLLLHGAGVPQPQLGGWRVPVISPSGLVVRWVRETSSCRKKEPGIIPLIFLSGKRE
jgi:hypothetical protein